LVNLLIIFYAVAETVVSVVLRALVLLTLNDFSVCDISINNIDRSILYQFVFECATWYVSAHFVS